MTNVKNNGVKIDFNLVPYIFPCPRTEKLFKLIIIDLILQPRGFG